MHRDTRRLIATAPLAGLLLIAAAWPMAQQQAPPPPPGPAAPATGGRGAPVQGAEEDLPLVRRFDRDGDKVLDYPERTAAREYLAANASLRRTTRAPTLTRTGTAGPRLSPNDVPTSAANVHLYDPETLRTLFLAFANADWEDELAAFWHTDVEVPATLSMDGKTYRDVGISFRGNNSFTAVPAGMKRPLSITMDLVRDQDLLGHKSLNLLNANQDPTFLRSVLYLDVARDYIPALKANFMRVVINGESWGVYVNQQTFSKEFLREAFKTTNGTRWKSPNNSVGGGFSYLGDDIALYRRWYEMKGATTPTRGDALTRATKILNETPPEQLEQALAPVMDVDEVLRFLALDVALVNNDGYWRDGSDFNLYLNERGRFLLHAARCERRVPDRRPWRQRRAAGPADHARRPEQGAAPQAARRAGVSRRAISPTSATSPRSGSIGTGWDRWSSGTEAHRRRRGSRHAKARHH